MRDGTSSGVAKQRRGVLGRDDVEADLARELEPREVGQARQHVYAPAEALRSARCGANPHVQRRARAEVAREAPEAVVQQRCAARPLALEVRPRAPRGELELER